MSIKVGDYIRTPRFLDVKIMAVLTQERALSVGFTEPTHYFEDEHYNIRGYHLGLNRMCFGAVRKPGAPVFSVDDVKALAPPLTDEQANMALDRARSYADDGADISEAITRQAIRELFIISELDEDGMRKHLMQLGYSVDVLEDENDPKSNVPDYTLVAEYALSEGWAPFLLDGEQYGPARYFKVAVIADMEEKA